MTEAFAHSIGLGYDGKTVSSAGPAAKHNTVVDALTSCLER